MLIVGEKKDKIAAVSGELALLRAAVYVTVANCACVCARHYYGKLTLLFDNRDRRN
jgi:hypothetical protein